MTFFLPTANNEPAAPAPRKKSGAGEVWGASWTAENIETDAWGRRQRKSNDVYAEIREALGDDYDRLSEGYTGLAGASPWSPKVDHARTLYALGRAAKEDPAKWARFPHSAEAVDQEVLRRLKAEHDDARDVLDMGGRGTGAVEFLGRGVAAVTDETNLLMLPFGGPSTGLLRTMAVEGALGVAGEAMTLPRQQQMSDLLGLPDPNVPVQLGTAGLFSAGMTGAFIGGKRAFSTGAEYWRDRSATTRAAKPEGMGAAEFDAGVDEAEAALRNGDPLPARDVVQPREDLQPVENFDWDSHREGGGLRSDAIEGMGDELRIGLENMITQAPPHIGQGLSVFSGYRSVETQVRLWEAAVKKYGSAKAARRHVAPPGKSQHNHGNAADLRWNGKRLDAAPKEVRDWVHANAGSFGLKFPMDWEPWHIEAASTRGGKTASAKAPPPKTRAGYTRTDEVVTPGGERISVAYEVVDESVLRAASGDLQPRDRSRASSDEQIAEMAARLDPARLMPSPEADRGAPVVGPDNVVESGNGRVAAIGQARERFGDRYEAYVETIKAAGFEIPEGVTRPVLIARRTTDLDDAGRQRFVRDANTSSIARMSATEQAGADARLIDERTLSFHRPEAGLTAPENRPFVQALLSRMPQSERNGLVNSRGELNADGIRRIRQAMFAAGYDAPDMVARLAEADGGNVRTIVEALSDVAPDWAILKADIAAGQIVPELDVSAQLLDAVRLVANARTAAQSEGRSVGSVISDLMNQSDLLGGSVDEITAAWVQVIYRGNRPRASADIADIARAYVTEARNVGKTDPGLFGSELAPTARDVLNAITREEGQQARAAETGQSAGRVDLGQGDGAQGAGTGRSSPAEGGQRPAQISLEGLDDEAFELGAQSPAILNADRQAAANLRNEISGEPFGPVRREFNDQPERAIEHLMQARTGEVPAAFRHPEIGDVAFVYGTKDLGLKHIADKHGEDVLKDLPRVLREGDIVARHSDRVYLETGDAPPRRAVVRLDYDGEDKVWLVTSYDNVRGENARQVRTSDEPPASASSRIPDATGRNEHTPSLPEIQDEGEIAAKLSEIRAAISENDFEVTLPDGQPYRASELLDDAEADVELADVLNLCNPGGAR